MSDAPKSTRQAVANIWRWVRAIPRRLTPSELHLRAVERKQRRDAVLFLQTKGQSGASHWRGKNYPRARKGYSKFFLTSFAYIAEHGRRPCYNNAGSKTQVKVARGSPWDRGWVDGWKKAVA